MVPGVKKEQKKRAIQELEHCLAEWGLGLTSGRNNQVEHDRARKRIVDALLKMLTATLPEPFSVHDVHSQLFPPCIDDAYKFVLAHDDVQLPYFQCYDKLDGLNPFFRCYDRREPKSNKNRQVTWYQRKSEFKGLPLEQLDPLGRFGYASIKEDELLFQRWFLADDASLLGVLMEAAVACHAIHKEACFNCKARRALRWKGGSAAAWQDLVCIRCLTIYEVKTKESMEEIQGVVDRSKIRGGSFREACRLENSLLEGQKRFVVFLPRKETSKRMQFVHPVQVVEIGSILPSVSRIAFLPPFFEGKENVELKSLVYLNSNTRQHWFDLPKVECSRSLRSIAKEVFVERFSEEKFEMLEAQYTEDLAGPPTIIQGSVPIQDPNGESNKLEKIKAELEETAAADDWEDLLSDSDDD